VKRFSWGVGAVLIALVSAAVPSTPVAAQSDINSLLILPRAAERNEFDSVLGMLQRGDPVDSEGEDQRTALSFAASNGNMQIMDLLLEHRADVDHRDRFRDTALHWAALSGQIDALKRLLAAHATIDVQNGQGATPLMLAIGANRREAVRVLVAAGANTQLQDFTGHDAAWYATDKPALLAILGHGHTAQ
jgi:ankyrin repeat protein